MEELDLDMIEQAENVPDHVDHTLIDQEINELHVEDMEIVGRDEMVFFSRASDS